MALAIYWTILKKAAAQWSDDKAAQLGAAIAFYSILSIGPLFLIAVAVAGLVYGNDAASGKVAAEMKGMVGGQAAEAIQTIIANSHQQGSGGFETLIGLGMMLIGASGVFVQLQDSLNTIWKVQASPEKAWWRILRLRLLSFSLVLGIGFLLLISLVLSAGLQLVSKYFIGQLPSLAPLLEAVNVLLTFGIAASLFAMIFKILPDIFIHWSDVWGGAAVTAGLFTIGKFFIGLYLGRSGMSSAYGAAGSLVVLSLWIYYSAQILLFGAELTYAYATCRKEVIASAQQAV